ncbi:MAG: holdfast attachment protein HfaA [Sphingomonadaceae bacterium]|nr:holdfast attachment protein HfaA [Sphingomonadaceae bacterium]|tara:strand:+ start:158 stop:589 length:432 start_codon:yes stop_codon:yes gene_type:complete
MTLRKFPPASAAVLAVTVLASAAQAQQAETTAGWEIPYGSRTTATSSQAWSGAGASAGAAARSEAGNRVIIDGVIQTGVGVSSQTGLFGGGVGSGATAIGNQLNVNVSGRYNTVIINSTQINNGDINANANANGNVSTDNDQD